MYFLIGLVAWNRQIRKMTNNKWSFMDNNNPENLEISEKIGPPRLPRLPTLPSLPITTNQLKLKRHPALQHDYSSSSSISGMETKMILCLFKILYTYTCKYVYYQLRTFKYILKWGLLYFA